MILSDYLIDLLSTKQNVKSPKIISRESGRFDIGKEKVNKKPWFLAFLLLVVYLSINGYKYGWDDQHLEIPLLKSLIDDSLYQNDYYVQSLKKSFSSYLYPLLAKCITVQQIPVAYFILFLLSRYFFFFWIFKIWHHLSKSLSRAFICVLVFILILRVQELLYNTFSHQEFAMAFIFAGIYYFFKERFILASAILGFAANFHALYSLFPFFYCFFYLVLSIKKHGWSTLIKSSAVFFIMSTPFALWVLKTHLGNYDESPTITNVNWIQIYQGVSPHNFLFPLVPFSSFFKSWSLFLIATERYLFVLILFLINLIFNKTLRENKKAVVFCVAAFFLLGISFYFTYLKPTRFFVDLNLIRNVQYLFFLVGGFTTLLIIEKIEKGPALVAFATGVIFSLLKFGYEISVLNLGIFFLLLNYGYVRDYVKSPFKIFIQIPIIALIATLAYLILQEFRQNDHAPFVMLNITILWSCLICLYFLNLQKKGASDLLRLRQWFYILPVCIFFYQYAFYHHLRTQSEKYDFGFWQLQRSWRDMQGFVRENTPKDAIILIPHDLDMDNFRIFSERSLVASYRDCGIIGFNMEAAAEWSRRMKDIEPFRIAIGKQLGDAIQKGIVKYKADYIVFMRYATPKDDNGILERIYTNINFALFKVIADPALESLRENF